MAKRHKKTKMSKEELIDDIAKAMKDPEIKRGIRQFVRVTSC